MDEHSRIIIEEYCRTHKTKKAAMLWDLLQLSYTFECEPDDDYALFMESTIAREKNPELKQALEELDEFLFG